MYRRILVGYDDSPASRAALLEAAAWVRRHGGELTILHAVFFESEEFSIAPEQLDRRLRAGALLGAAAKERAAAAAGVEARTVLREGEPPDAILEAARELDADLVVLGTYGRRGLNRMLMGSVTAQVVSRAPCDVLVVKKPCEDCRGEYRSILVPYDGSAFSRGALRRACELAKSDGARVTALYAIPRYEEMVGFLRTEGIRARLAEEAAKIVGEAARLAAEAGVTIATEVAEGPAADRAVAFAKPSGADLVVMGSHGHRGVERVLLGSTADGVILNAPCPVLVAKGRP